MNFYRRAPPSELLFLRLGAFLFACVAIGLGYLLLRGPSSPVTPDESPSGHGLVSEIEINSDRSLSIKEAYEITVSNKGPLNIERRYPVKVRYGPEQELTPRYLFHFARLNALTADGQRRTLALRQSVRSEGNSEIVSMTSDEHEIEPGIVQIRLEYSVLDVVGQRDGREVMRWNLTRLGEPGDRTLRVELAPPGTMKPDVVQASFYVMQLDPQLGWSRSSELAVAVQPRDQGSVVRGAISRTFTGNELAVLEVSWPSGIQLH